MLQCIPLDRAARDGRKMCKRCLQDYTSNISLSIVFISNLVELRGRESGCRSFYTAFYPLQARCAVKWDNLFTRDWEIKSSKLHSRIKRTVKLINLKQEWRVWVGTTLRSLYSEFKLLNFWRTFTLQPSCSIRLVTESHKTVVLWLGTLYGSKHSRRSRKEQIHVC